MHSQTAKLNFLFIIGTLTTASKATHADNINTAGTTCHILTGAQALDISYSGGAIFNLSAQDRTVECPIPRSPLITSTNPTFFIDGSNAPNTSTNCTVTMASPDLTAFSQQGFTESTPATSTSFRAWHHSVTLPIPASSSQSWHAYVQCTLPGIQPSGTGPKSFINSVTSLQ